MSLYRTSRDGQGIMSGYQIPSRAELPDISPMFASMGGRQQGAAAGQRARQASGQSDIKALPGAYRDYKSRMINLDSREEEFIVQMTSDFEKSDQDLNTYLDNNKSQIQEDITAIQRERMYVDSQRGSMERTMERYKDLEDTEKFYNQYVIDITPEGTLGYGKFKDPYKHGGEYGWGLFRDIERPFTGREFLRVGLEHIPMEGIAMPNVIDADSAYKKFEDLLQSKASNMPGITSNMSHPAIMSKVVSNMGGIRGFVSEAFNYLDNQDRVALLNRALGNMQIIHYDEEEGVVYGIPKIQYRTVLDEQGNETLAIDRNGNIARDLVRDSDGKIVYIDPSVDEQEAIVQEAQNLIASLVAGEGHVTTEDILDINTLQQMQEAERREQATAGIFTSIAMGYTDRLHEISRNIIQTGDYETVDLVDSIEGIMGMIVDENERKELNTFYKNSRAQYSKDIEKDETYIKYQNEIEKAKKEGNTELVNKLEAEAKKYKNTTFADRFAKELKKSGKYEDLKLKAASAPAAKKFTDYLAQFGFIVSAAAAYTLLPGSGLLLFSDKIRYSGYSAIDNLLGTNIVGEEIIDSKYDFYDAVAIVASGHGLITYNMDEPTQKGIEAYYPNGYTGRIHSIFDVHSTQDIMGDRYVPFRPHGGVTSIVPFPGKDGEKREWASAIEGYIYLTRDEVDGLHYMTGGERKSMHRSMRKEVFEEINVSKYIKIGGLSEQLKNQLIGTGASTLYKMPAGIQAHQNIDDLTKRMYMGEEFAKRSSDIYESRTMQQRAEFERLGESVQTIE